MDSFNAICYHKIKKFDLSGIWVTPKQFDKQMQYLYKNKYNSIFPEENKKEKDIIITFDDGYESFYWEAFPILSKYGFKAIVFIPSKYIGKNSEWDVNFGKKEIHLSLQQLIELKKYGIEIGSHSSNHLELKKLPIEKAKEEIINSKKELEDKLGSEVKYFSFPFGRYNNYLVNLVKDAGYKFAFSSNPFANGDIVIGRIGVYIIDGLVNFKAKLQKNTFTYMVEAKKSQIINAFSYLTYIWKTFNLLQNNRPTPSKVTKSVDYIN